MMVVIPSIKLISIQLPWDLFDTAYTILPGMYVYHCTLTSKKDNAGNHFPILVCSANFTATTAESFSAAAIPIIKPSTEKIENVKMIDPSK